MWEEIYKSKDGRTILSIQKNKVIFQTEDAITYNRYLGNEEAKNMVNQCLGFLDFLDNLERLMDE